MSVNVERLSENSVKVTVEVSAEEFDQALDKAFEKVVKDVKADGFRPGKMPKTIFIQRYGWGSLYQDALQFVFESTYPKAVMEAKVFPTDEPKVDLDYSSLEKGKGFTYTAEVDVWPEVHLGEYKGIKVKPLSTRVLKKDIDEEVKKVLDTKVENVIKDTPAENGDTVVIDFEGFVNGVAFDGGKADNYPVDAYLDYVKADLKKRKEQEAESHLVNSLVDAVCKASYAEFPKSLIDSEVENQVKRVEEQAKQYKMPVEVLLQYSGMASLDDFKKNAEDYARKSFLQELVIDKIIELEKIEASDKEIEAEYKKIAGVKDQDKDADKKIAQVKKQYRINQVAYQVKANKVIELLKANAITKTQKSE